jgi:aspartate racemase
MKTIGLVGITWVSTAVYFKTINQLVAQRLGGAHSAKLLLSSLDFHELKTLVEQDDWIEIEARLIDVARRLEQGGAECIVIGSNTPHLIADAIRARVHIPLLHIVEETAKAIVLQRARKVGLLGTKVTMESAFYRDGLAKHDIETLVPGDADRAYIHARIFDELTQGVFTPETKRRFLDVIETLRAQGADGIVLGCTEIPLLLEQSDCSIPVFDTTALHARAAVDFALQT